MKFTKLSELTPSEKKIQEFCCNRCLHQHDGTYKKCPWLDFDNEICPALTAVLIKKYIKEKQND